MKNTNNGVLADTSAWIEFFKQKSAIGNRLEALLIEDSVWVCGVVIFELLQGVKSDTEKSKILNALSNLKYTEMSKPLWQKSADISSKLKKNGVTVPLSDICIAAIAIENNLAVLTLDSHFKQIPGITIA